MNARIQCVPHKRGRRDDDRGRVFHAREALPFVESQNGRYTHRVRCVALYTLHTPKYDAHLGVSCWCGQSILISKRKAGRLVDSPTDGYVVCATCEGRAIGSGQLGSRIIAGREVMFRPSAAV